MVFLFGLWFSFGCMVFLWVHGFPFESMLVFFLWVYVSVFPLCLCYSCVLSGLRIGLYGRGEVCFAQRAREALWRENTYLTATSTQLGRGLSYSGCTEIQGWRRWTGNGGGRRYRDDGDGLGNGGVRRSMGNRDWLSNWGDIFGRLRGREHRILYLIWYHLISSYHTTNYTLHLAHPLISLALSETPCGSTQLRGTSQPGTIIASHPLPTLLEPELLYPTNVFWNAARGGAECDDVLSAI